MVIELFKGVKLSSLNVASNCPPWGLTFGITELLEDL